MLKYILLFLSLLASMTSQANVKLSHGNLVIYGIENEDDMHTAVELLKSKDFTTRTIVIDSQGISVPFALRMTVAAYTGGHRIVAKNYCYSTCVLMLASTPYRFMEEGTDLGLYPIILNNGGSPIFLDFMQGASVYANYAALMKMVGGVEPALAAELLDVVFDTESFNIESLKPVPLTDSQIKRLKIITLKKGEIP